MVKIRLAIAPELLLYSFIQYVCYLNGGYTRQVLSHTFNLLKPDGYFTKTRFNIPKF